MAYTYTVTCSKRALTTPASVPTYFTINVDVAEDDHNRALESLEKVFSEWNHLSSKSIYHAVSAVRVTRNRQNLRGD